MALKNNFAGRVIAFNKSLRYTGELPEGVMAINPFEEHESAEKAMESFYNRFYADNKERHLIIGINPSRHGAGVTGVPFTDTKRLESVCKIKMPYKHSHEPSSVFVYDMIEAYGGAEKFYGDFYINSPFPLALVKRSKEGKWLNMNYYDDKNLQEALTPYMVETMRKHLACGIFINKAFVLGKKNAQFLERINKQFNFFEKLVVLEHPRYIQQYKTKLRQLYIDKYLEVFYNRSAEKDL